MKLKYAILDLLLTATIILGFAFFHHVLPAMNASRERQAETETVNEVVSERETEILTEEPETEEPEPTPDERTEWQIKFADHFTDDVVITDHSYSSPNVSVTVDTFVTGEGNKTVTYYIADIYVASIDCLKTYLSHGEYTYYDTQDAEEMDKAANAIISINGDFCTYQKDGFLIRNGEIIRNNFSWSTEICALFEDGTMETYAFNTYKNEDLIEKGAWQVWQFGPSLLDEEGHHKPKYVATSSAVQYINPRSAIGYYEPGHYCFVTVDGRQEGYSRGMLLYELGYVFENLGCKCAYNLDGGGSTVLLFNHERYNRQCGDDKRELGDIIYICEPQGDRS